MSVTSQDSRIQQIEARLEEVGEKTGLNTDVFDKIELDDSLPENIPAATKLKQEPYRLLTLIANPSLLYRPRADQGLVLTHEAVHGNDFNYTLLPQLSDAGMDYETNGFLKSKLDGDLEEKEAATELIARTLFPLTDMSYTKGYPYETDKLIHEAEQKGLELDSGLTREIEQYTADLIDRHADHEVFDRETRENRSFEYGRIGNVPYIGLETREQGKEPEGLAEDIQNYLEELADEYDEIDEYLTESDYEMEYGEGSNFIGNIDQEAAVPLEASMGTGNTDIYGPAGA